LIKLRDYQMEATADVLQMWDVGFRGVLLHLATGLGKTVCMGSIHNMLRERGKGKTRILVIAHLGELLDSASATFKLFDDKPTHYFERNEEYVPSPAIAYREPEVVFGMVQSLHRRLEKYPTDYFTHIFIDETHRAPAETYRRILSHFNDAKLLGVTATPKRADKVGLKIVFDQVSSCSMSVTQGIGLGWLVPFRPTSYQVRSLDYSKCKVRGDFTDEQIEKALMANGKKPLYEIAAGLKEMADGLQTIVFVSGVDSARELAGIMRHEYDEPCDFVCGTTDSATRKDIIARYRSGECRRIINVGVLTEGVDLPNTQCVAIARITRSEGRYLQMAGRGTRPYPSGLVDRYDTPEDRVSAILASKKDSCLLLDFKGNMGRVRPAIDGRNLLAGLLPHKSYNGKPTPSAANVSEMAEIPGNEKLSIEELRQLASDKLFIEMINSKSEFLVGGVPGVKEAEIQQYDTLFGVPWLPESKREAKPKHLPPQRRADPEVRGKIIRLHERLGLPPPETDYLLGMSKAKGKKEVNQLLREIGKQASDQ
jgi:superfamily II DNA or RNA helicase